MSIFIIGFCLENVEVNQGRVVVCRDASKGRCSRIPCKYYHIPLFAISAGRSLALNSALAASLTGHASANIVSSSGNNSGNSMTAVYTGASSASVASSSSAGLVAGCGSTSASSTSPHRSI
ncbi:unnamed protein product [Protopolystoma xenopodis]|uniref:C3H1-type domain-containing protein n=1 Tax=Protopolystoma xenopodis TaxID=117903 RepID=A0A448XHP5_9PLAT|nr:unnamed protein product [Protopolystoma xenopodis]